MSANTRDIRRRIRSVRNTQQITKAMKMVAAARLRKAQTRLMAVRPYEEAVAATLGRLLPRLVGDEHPLLTRHGDRRLALVVITGDKGLCGSYNHNLIRQAEQFLRDHRDRDVRLTAIGKKGAKYFAREGYDLAGAYTDMAESVTFKQAAAVMHKLIGGFLAGECDEVHVLYSYFKSTISQRPQIDRLLPFDLPPVADLAAAGPMPEIMFEPSVEDAAAAVLEESLDVRLFRALLESASSEHGARMTSMENATNNADDMIADLTLQFNRARQAVITKEISEIVGGAEALGK
ncbi:MAG TPA: ATP synthase F1 subunit gamma [Phycisphaerae bacterium]|nr:ATP synthase F1 subunit gamma [Phycisphaerae bacterium]HOI54658.1 ATP synthase F1 subunit gamma [Phycisphaerae bacterium]